MIMAGQVGIRVSDDARDALMKMKLNLAARIGRDVSMGTTLKYLIILGEKHFVELAEIASK